MTCLLVDFSHPLFQPFERGVYHTVDSDLDGFVKRKGIPLADFERFHTALDFYFDVSMLFTRLVVCSCFPTETHNSLLAFVLTDGP